MPARDALTLVLVQQRQRGDQRQVLGMVPPHPRLVDAKGQLLGPGNDHAQRFEQPLGVLVPLAYRLAIGRDAFQRVGRPLPLVDGRGLCRLLVDRQAQAAVEQLGIRFFGRGGQQHGHRAFDFVVLRLLAARVPVLARAGDGQPPFALQELERVAGLRDPFLFGQGQDLVLQLRASHVVQRLAGQRREAELRFGRHEGQRGFHQRRLAGGRAALDEDRQRPGQVPGDAGQVADQLVGLFPHQATGVVVGQDPREQFAGP